MELVKPSVKYKDSYLAAIREFQLEGQKMEFSFDAAKRDFATFVRELNERVEGKHLPEGFVPESVYWLVDGDEYIGRLSIRHRLNKHLLEIGGHIGYDIRPSKRQRGYGTQILRLGLLKAKGLGIYRALLTCNATNTSSLKIIEKAGGILENKVPNPEGGPDKLRFWIDVAR